MCGTLPVMMNRLALVIFFSKEGRFVGGRKGFRGWGLGVFKSIQYDL